jgi:hypothetical protein
VQINPRTTAKDLVMLEETGTKVSISTVIEEATASCSALLKLTVTEFRTWAVLAVFSLYTK